MFEQASAPAERNVIGDRVLRGGIALFFASAGLVLLACTMASAALLLIFVAGHPADSVYSGTFFGALTLFGVNRWKQNA